MGEDVSLPESWLQCPNMGDIIQNLIYPFKTILDERYNGLVSIKKRFNVRKLNKLITTYSLRLIIDLTYDNIFYDPRKLKKTNHVRIFEDGFTGVPKQKHIFKFILVIEDVVKLYPDGKIGVHCVHGFNVTGFMIISYLVISQLIPLDQAFRIFAEARPPGVYNIQLIDELKRLHDKDAVIPVPEEPDWIQDIIRPELETESKPKYQLRPRKQKKVINETYSGKPISLVPEHTEPQLEIIFEVDEHSFPSIVLSETKDSPNNKDKKYLFLTETNDEPKDTVTFPPLFSTIQNLDFDINESQDNIFIQSEKIISDSTDNLVTDGSEFVANDNKEDNLLGFYSPTIINTSFSLQESYPYSYGESIWKRIPILLDVNYKPSNLSLIEEDDERSSMVPSMSIINRAEILSDPKDNFFPIVEDNLQENLKVCNQIFNTTQNLGIKLSESVDGLFKNIEDPNLDSLVSSSLGKALSWIEGEPSDEHSIPEQVDFSVSSDNYETVTIRKDSPIIQIPDINIESFFFKSKDLNLDEAINRESFLPTVDDSTFSYNDNELSVSQFKTQQKAFENEDINNEICVSADVDHPFDTPQDPILDSSASSNKMQSQSSRNEDMSQETFLPTVDDSTFSYNDNELYVSPFKTLQKAFETEDINIEICVSADVDRSFDTLQDYILNSPTSSDKKRPKLSRNEDISRETFLPTVDDNSFSFNETDPQILEKSIQDIDTSLFPNSEEIINNLDSSSIKKSIMREDEISEHFVQDPDLGFSSLSKMTLSSPLKVQQIQNCFRNSTQIRPIINPVLENISSNKINVLPISFTKDIADSDKADFAGTNTYISQINEGEDDKTSGIKDREKLKRSLSGESKLYSPDIKVSRMEESDEFSYSISAPSIVYAALIEKAMNKIPKFIINSKIITPINDYSKLEYLRNVVRNIVKTSIYGFIGARYSYLTKRNISKLKMKHYFNTWITNGKRYLFFIDENAEAYFIDDKNWFYKASNVKFPYYNNNIQPLKNTIFDGELFQTKDVNALKNYTYVISNIYSFHGKKYEESNFVRRLDVIEKLIIQAKDNLELASFIKEPFIINLKRYSKPKNLEKVWNSLRKSIDHEMRGLAFYPFDSSLHNCLSSRIIYLWQPQEFKTVDFKFKSVINKKENSNIGNLFVCGSNEPYAKVTNLSIHKLKEYDNKIVKCRFNPISQKWSVVEEQKEKNTPISKWEIEDRVADITNPILFEDLLQNK